MARLTFRKSIRIAPGVRVNVTHRGVRSVSAGAGGLRLTQDLDGGRSQPRSRARAATSAAPFQNAPAVKPGRKLMWMWIWTAMLFVGSFGAPPAFLISVPMLIVAIVWSLAAAAPKPAASTAD